MIKILYVIQVPAYIIESRLNARHIFKISHALTRPITHDNLTRWVILLFSHFLKIKLELREIKYWATHVVNNEA